MQVALTQGLCALVDDEDYEAIAQFKWCVLRTPTNIYAKRLNVGILMHRVIMAPPPGLVVDHVNFDGLDNRRSNLRICTQAENAIHRKRVPPGVWQIHNGKWRARAVWLGKSHHLGYFWSRAEAIDAVNVFRRKTCPEFAGVAA